MDSKTLIQALKRVVREEVRSVIQEELTQILREGLQTTISEMKKPVKPNNVSRQQNMPAKKKPMFEDNRWASILNDTDPLSEQQPLAMNSFRDMMNEGFEEIRMTSRDAQGFGAMRQNMRAAISGQPSAPAVMEDPETGKTFQVTPEVQQAMTRDYSALMKAMNKKKGG